MKLIFGVFISLVALSVFAQSEVPENIDFFGGYLKDGVYTCYAQPCFKIHKGTDSSAAWVRPFEVREWVPIKGSKDACQVSYSLVLAQSSQADVEFKTYGDCRLVTKGQWSDFYTGQTISSIKNVAVDHLISFQEAHYYGGSLWVRSKRKSFMNDPMNLVPVSLAFKKLRAGAPASKWMPEDKKKWCDYIVKRDLVVRRYKLRLPKHEKDFGNNIKRLYCKY